MTAGLKRPATPECLAKFAEPLPDEASQREVQSTTRSNRETLRRHFLGKSWTFMEAGMFLALIKEMGTP